MQQTRTPRPVGPGGSCIAASGGPSGLREVPFEHPAIKAGPWPLPDGVEPLGHADNTPPTIVPTITGTLGSNGGYTSNVGVTWTVTDGESTVSSTQGSDASSVTPDTQGDTFTCTAISQGGSASESATIKRDATTPVIGYAGNAGSYSASAQDVAGNRSTASTSFTVAVTSGSLCALVERWVSNTGVANSLCVKLRQGSYGAFRNELSAPGGKKFLSAANAAILLQLVNLLA